MKKMSQKNNKGFSLVELIVVVAIMAVLMGILVPTLVKNVEKSKKQKDASAIEEIRSTMVTTLADPTYSDIEATIVYDGTTIDVDTPKNISELEPNVKTFLTAVSADVKDWEFTSKAYKADDEVTFVISGQMVTAYREAEGETAPGAGGAGANNSSSTKN